jgi:hypothetical protein
MFHSHVIFSPNHQDTLSSSDSDLESRGSTVLHIQLLAYHNGKLFRNVATSISEYEAIAFNVGEAKLKIFLFYFGNELRRRKTLPSSGVLLENDFFSLEITHAVHYYLLA